jgi:hypothetical protein
MADAQSILTVGLPTLAVLIGILVNNSRFGDFNNRLGEIRSDMHRRFDDMHRRFDDVNSRIDDTRDLLRAEFYRVEQVTDARLKHLEEHR